VSECVVQVGGGANIGSRRVNALINPLASGLRLDPLAEGDIDAFTGRICSVARIAFIRAWPNKEVLRRNTSIEGKVTTDIIFNTGALVQGINQISNVLVRAPSTAKTKSLRLSQTSGAVSNCSKI
jgi:hypothetical protein